MVSHNQHESLSSQASSNLSNRDSNSSDLIVITSSQSNKCAGSASVSVSNSFKHTKLTTESDYSISSFKFNTDDTSNPINLDNKNKMELIELKTSPHNYSIHREMPVDVPDTFVGVIKQTPRYPPPHPPPQPPQRFSTLEHNNQLALNNRINSEKLRKYSDEIYRKKDEEIFRSSIRDSKKLQQLQERKLNYGEPVVNIAFEPDDEVLVAYNNNSYGSIPVRTERESEKSN